MVYQQGGVIILIYVNCLGATGDGTKSSSMLWILVVMLLVLLMLPVQQGEGSDLTGFHLVGWRGKCVG